MAYIDANGYLIDDPNQTGTILYNPTPEGLKLDSDYFRGQRERIVPYLQKGGGSNPYMAKGLTDPATVYALMDLGINSRNIHELLGDQVTPQLLADLQNAETGVPDAGFVEGFTDIAGDFLSDIAIPFGLGALGTYGAVAGLGGLTGGAAGSASGGATAAGTGAAGAGELASLVGPTTGTIEAAPVIGAAGAPTISAVASGAGPFVPVIGGATGISNAISGALDSASGGGTAGGAAAPGSLERILAAGLPAALGYLGADKQADAMGDLAERYIAMGEPYRQKLAEISADPSVFYDSPTATKATDAVLRRLSVGGNPAGNPYAQALTIDALYDQYGRERDRLAGFGGLTQYNAAAPSAATAAIGADANKYNAIGAGLADYFNPPRRVSLSDILRTGL
jgi:hypothetical protein